MGVILTLLVITFVVWLVARHFNQAKEEHLADLVERTREFDEAVARFAEALDDVREDMAVEIDELQRILDDLERQQSAPPHDRPGD